MAEGHPPAAAMASYRRSRLPFARPQTLQRSKSPPAPQGKGTPTSPTRATPCHAQRCRQKPPQGHSNGSRAPTAAAMAIRAPYRRSRLPFARTARKSHHKATAMAEGHPPAAAMAIRACRLPGLKRSKPSKSPPSSAGTRYPNKPNTRHSRTHKPPQGHSNG